MFLTILWSAYIQLHINTIYIVFILYTCMLLYIYTHYISVCMYIYTHFSKINGIIFFLEIVIISLLIMSLNSVSRARLYVHAIFSQ